MAIASGWSPGKTFAPLRKPIRGDVITMQRRSGPGRPGRRRVKSPLSQAGRTGRKTPFKFPELPPTFHDAPPFVCGPSTCRRFVLEYSEGRPPTANSADGARLRCGANSGRALGEAEPSFPSGDDIIRSCENRTAETFYTMQRRADSSIECKTRVNSCEIRSAGAL